MRGSGSDSKIVASCLDEWRNRSMDRADLPRTWQLRVEHVKEEKTGGVKKSQFLVAPIPA